MFCPRCGAPTEPGTAFCERCGERLTPPAPETAPSRPPRATLVAGAVALAVGIVVAVLALTGAFGGHDEPVARRVTVRPTVVAPEPTVTVETPPAETTAQPEPTRPARGVVSRTCGKDGIGGDCHLSVRTAPSPDAAELRRLDEGDPLRLSCQVRGEPVRSSALGTTSTVWSRTAQGGYVSNVYITGPSLKSQAITLRRC